MSDHLNQKQVNHLPTLSLPCLFFYLSLLPLSVGIPPSNPVFPLTHLKSSIFYLGKGEPLCFGIFRVHPQILLLLVSNLSLRDVCMFVCGVGGDMDPSATDAFICSHQAQTTCWDHPKMTELYQTLGKNSRFLYRVEIYTVAFVL